MNIILALRRIEDCQFKGSLSYMVRPYQKYINRSGRFLGLSEY